MTTMHSFTDYIAKAFNSQIWAAADSFLQNHLECLNVNYNKLHKPGETELQDVKVMHVWVDDQPDMQIKFDVAVSVDFVVNEANHHYDDYEEETAWLMVRCKGDLAQELRDFEIYDVSEYTGKNKAKKPMDDDIVPVISKDNLDSIAEKFLKKYYPKALLEPINVSPTELAKSLGLSIKKGKISADSSVFGRCYFQACETTLYDYDTFEQRKELIPAKTILVDESVSFLICLGALNNTIVHECVHWVFHKKAFALARLYNKDLTNISCKVTGGIVGNANEKNAVDWMEWQANALAPRIQMPLTTLKKRVDSIIKQYRSRFENFAMLDFIEPIIEELVITFGVSRLAAKIRLLDIGYDEAIGAFTYIDGHYVKAHKAKKGFLKPNQTFSIDAATAGILCITNLQLKADVEQGVFQYVDSHMVLNHSLYVEIGPDGNTQLTYYARSHMDECCLVFDLSIRSQCGEKYYSECFLNRDRASKITFDITFSGGVENAPVERQRELLKQELIDENKLLASLPNDYVRALNMTIAWCNERVAKENKKHPRKKEDKITAVEIAERTGMNEATVRRTLNGEGSSTNTLILICLALHIPYNISKHIINNSRYPLVLDTEDNQWYDYVLKVHYGKPVKEVKRILQEYGAKPL